MSTFYIFHFRPLEHYPPIQNLLNYLNDSSEVDEVVCFSTYGKLISIEFGNQTKVFRFGKVGGNKIVLWLTYFYYNLVSIAFLLLKHPKQIMYFESLSAYPVYFYKRFINSNVNIYIHYHEYTSKGEYIKASRVERFFHAKEKYLYPKAKWISHTNEIRLAKFLIDEKLEKDEMLHRIMPNYPARNWAKANTSGDINKRLKIVYVGYSLTKEGSYFNEIIDFLKEREYPIELNVYCIQSNDFMKNLEGQQGNLSVKLHQAVSYGELPKILSQHHIGVILYKAKTQNYINNAPNKLFEYLSCGLDVWYPKGMQGIYDYDSKVQPKVLRLDFNQMKKYNLKELIKDTETKNKITYFAEDVYGEFLKAFNKQA